VVHNTDSIFTMYDTTHLKTQQMRVAYSGIVAAFVADRITQYLRSLNPWKPPSQQWMLLEYEKTYKMYLLFSKKRYAGEMTEFDPFHYEEDKKGVALKRRDFCSFVKEVYSKILKAFFEDSNMTRAQRIEYALAIVQKAIDDLLNNRVPFDKLIISQLLKDSYKVRMKKQSSQKTKKAQLSDFGPHNIFIGDKILFGNNTTGKVIGKDNISTKMFFGAGKAPLRVRVKGSGVTAIQYSDIKERLASVMYLDKILDPKTKEAELEPIKKAHVRLARRMYLRDPATAPPSGTRVPYVFCEPKRDNVLQYMRAEHPAYAKEHNLKVDPIYYLKKQCANAWGQILNTACPGLVDALFNSAYTEHTKRKNRQTDITSFFIRK